MKFSRNESGNALVGVLASVGIFGVISVGMATLISDIWKAQNASRSLAEANNLHEEIRVDLAKKESCFETFKVLQPFANPSSKPVTEIKHVDDSGTVTTKYRLATAYAGGTVEIHSMTINYPNTDPITDINEANFSIVYKPRGTTIGPDRFKARGLILAFKLDGSGNLLECSSKSKGTDGIWRRNVTESSKIFYSEGNVGIGTMTPSAPLNIVTTDSSRNYNILLRNQSAGATAYSGVAVQNDAGRVMAVGVGSSGNTDPWGAVTGNTLGNAAFLGVVGNSTGLILYSGKDNTDTSPIVLTTGGRERMRIAADGRLGIGTSAPGAALHAVGGAMIFERSGRKMFIDPNNVDSNTWSQIQTDPGMGFFFRTDGGNKEPLKLAADGKVAIGHGAGLGSAILDGDGTGNTPHACVWKTNVISGNNDGDATCPTGQIVLSGGSRCDSSATPPYLRHSHPSGQRWHVYYNGTCDTLTIYALCCKI